MLEAIPRTGESKVEHATWQRAPDDLTTTHQLAFKEVDAIASAANGQVACALEEGYLFGLAVGRQLGAEDAVRGDEDDELATLQAMAAAAGGAR